MRTVRLIDPRGNMWNAEVPTTRRERVRGLLGREGLTPHGAMLFERVRSVHSFGMRFPIGVALLDAEFRVVRVLRVRPGRVVLPRSRVRHVLECSVDADLLPGDVLRPAAARSSKGEG